MKNLLVIISIVLVNCVSSQTFMSKEDFIKKSYNQKINDSIKKIWESNLTSEEKNSIDYVKGLPDIIVDWELTYDYTSKVSGFNANIINNSNKTIKYVYFKLKALNGVDDVTYDGIKTTRGTGPIHPGEIKKGTFENCWLINSDISSVRMIHIIVEFMDKTKKTLNLNKVLLNKDLFNLEDDTHNKLDNMIKLYYEELYSQYLDGVKNKYFVEQLRIKDSIYRRQKHIKDSLYDVRLKKLYDEKIRRYKSTMYTITKLSQLDKKKLKFVSKKFNINIMEEVKLIQDTLKTLNVVFNLTDVGEIKRALSKMDTSLINNIFNYHFYVHYRYGILYNDFYTKPLKETETYIKHKEFVDNVNNEITVSKKDYDKSIQVFNDIFKRQPVKRKNNGKIVPLIILPPFLTLAVLVGVINVTE